MGRRRNRVKVKGLGVKHAKKLNSRQKSLWMKIHIVWSIIRVEVKDNRLGDKWKSASKSYWWIGVKKSIGAGN
jgi:hypothetical protein